MMISTYKIRCNNWPWIRVHRLSISVEAVERMSRLTRIQASNAFTVVTESFTKREIESCFNMMPAE